MTKQPALAYDIAPARTQRDDDEPLHGVQKLAGRTAALAVRARSECKLASRLVHPTKRLGVSTQPPSTHRQQPKPTPCTTLIVPDGGLALWPEYSGNDACHH